MSRLIITEYNGRILSALYDGDRVIELHLEDRGLRVGDIWTGRVENKVSNIGSAFVLTDGRTNCYLPENEGLKITPGMELPVQVTRAAVRLKAPQVSARLSLSGKYVVITESGEYKRAGISAKITDPGRREQLSALLDGHMSGMTFEGLHYTAIARTNSAEASDADILSETDSLTKQLQEIRQTAAHRPCYTRLKTGDSRYIELIRDSYADSLEEIVTDIGSVYDELKDVLPELGTAAVLRRYDDKMVSLSKVYSIETVIRDATSRIVWLPSGGYLIIEPTEALTVIDVNTGKYSGHKKTEETFLKINLEAAAEAAAQLRLRNISGIVIVDFIDMKDPGHIEQLTAEFRRALSADPARATLHDITRLGLAEVTRKRVYKPFAEQLSK